jgi:hypothetical protein
MLTISFFRNNNFYKHILLFSISWDRIAPTPLNQIKVKMGWCQRADTSKNKKVTENFPLLVYLPWGSGVKIL